MTALAELLRPHQAAALATLRVQLRRAELARLNAPAPHARPHARRTPCTTPAAQPVAEAPVTGKPPPAVFREPETEHRLATW